jgi:uncharacterized protein
MPFVVSRRAQALGFGALESDPDGILDLPPGFSYSVLETAGGAMSDGYLVPYRPDGMAAFPGPDGTVVLMRNHELDADSGLGAYGTLPVPPEAYDTSRAGGVTRLVVDGTTFARISSNLVLTGTSRNCQGGASPWGWLSCEESTLEGHGYTFLCRTDAATVQPPERMVCYGRLYHEGLAIEPATNAAYITEDRGDGCLYRFLPDDPGTPFVGKLQALAIVDQPRRNTQSGMTRGEALDVVWVDVGDPDSASDTLRYRATDAGAATFYRLEGIMESDGVIYTAATFGGDAGYGQIFAIRPTRDGGTLTLLAESKSPDVLNGPDGLAPAPWGDIVVSEDGTESFRYLRGVTASGIVYDIGRTNRGELCGVCFSADGRALFVNIQELGVTLVVTGPFSDYDPTGGEGGQPGEGGNGDGASSGLGGTAGNAGGATAGSTNGNGGTTSGGATGSAGASGTASSGAGAGSGGRGGALDGAGRSGGGAAGYGHGGGRARVQHPGLRRDLRLTTTTDPGCACGVVGQSAKR